MEKIKKNNQHNANKLKTSNKFNNFRLIIYFNNHLASIFLAAVLNFLDLQQSCQTPPAVVSLLEVDLEGLTAAKYIIRG